MKRALTILVFLLGSLPAVSQNWTTVSASNITDLNQNKLAAGQLCFLGTDQNDNPISFNAGGGGQVLKRAFCSAVSSGTVTAFTVPNPANTTPAGIYYRVTVKDTSTAQEVLRYTQVAFTGGAFNFDNYAPTNIGSFTVPSGLAITGNLSVNGNISTTGTLSASNLTIPLNLAGGGTNATTAAAAFNNLNPMTTLGDTIYASAANTASRLAGNTSATTKYLSETGTGSASAAPAWTQPSCASLSNAAPSCSTDTTNASNISSGTLAVARGGTGVAAAQGNGSKVQLSTGSSTTNDFVSFDANGNTQDSGKAAPAGTVVGTSDTQTLTNKTLNGASSGNSVTLLNEQGPVTQLTGNSADQTVYTYTLPANTMQAGKGIRIRIWSQHSSGSAAIIYKIFWGPTVCLGPTITEASGNTDVFELVVFNNPGVTNAQHCSNFIMFQTPGVLTNTATTASVDTTSSVVIKFTFNVANTDKVTGGEFIVELLQ